jgi:hypothetical protein
LFSFLSEESDEGVDVPFDELLQLNIATANEATNSD